ncbi:primase-helicase family protein, partial [Bradyrhizobium sp. AUGA SZCCT0182]|uniref:primase-helicase family protein n=1 Tax=Bradyrhizobium sp. AUGA SZCCT0182 TaxID=2807667 RepID=UPI0020126807
QALLDIVCNRSSKGPSEVPTPREGPKSDHEWSDFSDRYGEWSRGASSSRWRNFNTAMLGVLSAWVPPLLPKAKAKYGGYRLTSKDLGRDLQEDLAIMPSGIRDHGAGVGYTGIDLVMKYLPTADFDAAVAWLTEKTGIEVGDGGETKDIDKNDGVTLKDFYAYMPTHRYIFAPTGEMWPACSVNERVPPVLLSKTDEECRMKASQWLDKYQAVEQMTWSPGLPMTIADRLISDGGWIERKGVTTFNLYCPPTIIHGNSAAADRWVDLVHRIYPEDAGHIITFAAQRVQHPEVKINHGLVLGGAPGIGKDTILEPLKHGVGPWNFKEISPPDIMSPHNDFMRCTVLRISEAHDLGEVNRFTFYDRLKTMQATPPDVTRINAKYVPQYYALNVAGIILTTNYRFDGIYLPADDRRTYVAWSDTQQADFASGFWSSLWDWYHAGGLENVVAYLAEMDISHFDPKAPPKKTHAFWQIVGAGAAPEDSEMADILDRLGTAEGARDAEGKPCGPAVTTQAKVEALANTGNFHEWLTDRKNRRVIPHRFEKCGYVPVRNEDAKDGLWVIGGKRQTVYGRSDLPLSERVVAARRLSNAGNR